MCACVSGREALSAVHGEINKRVHRVRDHHVNCAESRAHRPEKVASSKPLYDMTLKRKNFGLNLYFKIFKTRRQGWMLYKHELRLQDGISGARGS